MKVADASVAVAAASPWHEGHEAAFNALATGRPGIVAHAAVETYSALTRMPEGARMHPDGATYDALIGAAAAAEGATLVTADSRALPTYALVGADVELVA